MSHSDVAPIEDHGGALRPPHVARMEVAVDERIGHPTGIEVVEDRRQPRNEGVEDASLVGRRARCDHVGREVEIRRTTPIGRAEREQVVLTPDPLDLQGDERVEHRLELVALGVVAVVAGDVGEQHSSRLAGDESRHARVVAERGDIEDSCAKNGGTCFSHTSPSSVGIFQIDDRFHVRICTGEPLIVDVARCP